MGKKGGREGAPCAVWPNQSPPNQASEIYTISKQAIKAIEAKVPHKKILKMQTKLWHVNHDGT